MLIINFYFKQSKVIIQNLITFVKNNTIKMTLLHFLENLMLILVIGGGLYLLFQSKGQTFGYIKRITGLLKKKSNNQNNISSFEALTAVIASTVGLGNIAGVAIAIYMGGPGVVFWMWVTALLGMVIKFYSCSLSVYFRKLENDIVTEAGPMYYMSKAIKKWGVYLAFVYAASALVGVLPVFTSNQMTQTIVNVGFVKVTNANHLFFIKLSIGFILCLLSMFVVLGGLKKIVSITSKMVPLMVAIYLLMAFWVILTNFSLSIDAFESILREAFQLKTTVTGGLMGLIILGMRRAVFSSETGLGTAAMYHGETSEKNPLNEGAIAMLGPFIDTIVVCTITTLVILVSGVYQQNELNGIALTLTAFEHFFGVLAKPLLLIIVLIFGLTTLFTYAFYGLKAMLYLWNDRMKKIYYWPYFISIIFASVATLEFVIDLIDFTFAIMSITNMIAVIWLSKHIKKLLKND